MDPDFQSTNPQSPGTFRVVWGVLAVVALAQGVAAAMAWKDHRIPAAALMPPVAPPAAIPAVALEPDPFSSESGALPDPHPELLKPAALEPGLPDPGEPVVARLVVMAAPLDVPITDAACLAQLDEGIYLRDRGDMVGAVAQLRGALELVPEHPKLLYQLALTLDGLSQERKASEHWRKLRLLGQGAGNYYQLAVERLKEGGSLPPPADTVFEADEVKQGRFTVSGVKVERLPDSALGESWIICGRIDRHQAEPAEVANIALKLHLFDEVNGQRIDRFLGEPPPHAWPETPVDWADGSERFEFVCNRPLLSPDELVKRGQRKFYGYALEIRYGTQADFKKNELQDLAAEPALLAEMSQEMPEWTAFEEPPPGLEGMIPGVSGALPDQPDAVLFPGDKFER